MSIFPSLTHIFFSQFMPRAWVDDLEGWTQIAFSSPNQSLTTFTTPRVTQRLFFTGLLLLHIFLMMNFNGLLPLETAQDREHWPFYPLNVRVEPLETWSELMNWPGYGARSHFFIVKEGRKEGFKSVSTCNAGLHSTLINATCISLHIAPCHIQSLP